MYSVVCLCMFYTQKKITFPVLCTTFRWLSACAVVYSNVRVLTLKHVCWVMYFRVYRKHHTQIHTSGVVVFDDAGPHARAHTHTLTIALAQFCQTARTGRVASNENVPTNTAQIPQQLPSANGCARHGLRSITRGNARVDGWVVVVAWTGWPVCAVDQRVLAILAKSHTCIKHKDQPNVQTRTLATCRRAGGTHQLRAPGLAWGSRLVFWFVSAVLLAVLTVTLSTFLTHWRSRIRFGSDVNLAQIVLTSLSKMIYLYVYYIVTLVMYYIETFFFC